jgi:hypothetical protein
LSPAQDQTRSTDQLAFDRAIELFEDEQPQAALLAFTEFRETYPNSPLAPRAHFNIGFLNWHLKNNPAAIMAFQEILEQPYNEQDENNLMEPYALYKHHSCRYLAEIYLEEKNYDEASQYIYLFDKEYPYQHFCGNEWAAYDMYKAVMYARLYEGENKIEKAVKVLVPHIFANGLASNQEVLEQLIGLLERHFPIEQIKRELQAAYVSLTITEKRKEKKASLLLYGERVSLDEYFYEEDSTKELSDLARYQALVNSNPLFEKFLGNH